MKRIIVRILAAVLVLSLLPVFGTLSGIVFSAGAAENAASGNGAMAAGNQAFERIMGKRNRMTRTNVKAEAEQRETAAEECQNL